jgi:uncharacterized protein (TIGR02217 family)
MAFDEIRLPVDIEQGAIGGPTFSTTVLLLAKGSEQRNQNWTQARYEGDIGYGIQSQSDYSVVRNFFYARRGRARGFRFKDWSDYQSNGAQVIGIGDGSTKIFQLVNVYTDSVNAYTRTIIKPVAGTVAVYDNGVLGSPSVDTTTGLVTYVTAPLAGHAISATFQFDLAVRFDVDKFPITIAQIDAGQIGSLAVIEITA